MSKWAAINYNKSERYHKVAPGVEGCVKQMEVLPATVIVI